MHPGLVEETEYHKGESDCWRYTLNIESKMRTIYPGGLNKVFSSKFQNDYRAVERYNGQNVLTKNKTSIQVQMYRHIITPIPSLENSQNNLVYLVETYIILDWIFSTGIKKISISNPRAFYDFSRYLSVTVKNVSIHFKISMYTSNLLPIQMH